VIRIPAHLLPATVGELWRMVAAIPAGLSVEVVAWDGSVITYRRLA
jgi:hypothetical protein